jgi:2'-5' RNA ligase
VVRTAPERLHVTLRFLGEVPASSWTWPVSAGAGVVGPVVARLGAATATFGRRSSVLHVPVAGLEGLAAVVDPAPARPFTGHLTVRRGRDVGSLAGAAVPEAARTPWPVDEVTLVVSSGGRYEVVSRLPLSPSA